MPGTREMPVSREEVPSFDDGAAAKRAAFVEALRRGDAREASGLYARNAKLLPPSTGLLRGRGAIERFWRAGLEAGIADAELEPLEFEHEDGLVYEFGRYRLVLHPAEGGRVVDRGTYLLIHERRPDGTWEWSAKTLAPDPG